MNIWMPINTAPENETILVTDGEKRWFWNSNDYPEGSELKHWLIDLGVEIGTPLWWPQTPPLPAKE